MTALPRVLNLLRRSLTANLTRLVAGGEHLFVTLGDKARDGRDWQAAVVAYGQALEINFKLTGIWVQYGHALKESGRAEDALAAYMRALQLEPDNSDTALQIGHVLKILDRRDEAARWYAKSVLGSPSQRDGLRELSQLRLSRDAVQGLIGPDASHVRDYGSIIWDIGPRSPKKTMSTPSDFWREGLPKKLPTAANVKALQRPDRDEFWRFEKLVPGLVVMTPTPGELIDDFSDAMDRVWLAGSAPVVNLIGHSAWFEAGLTLESDAVAQIDKLLARAGGALVASSFDAQIIDSRARRMGSPLRATQLHLPPGQHQASGAAAARGRNVAVLASQNAKMTETMVESLGQYRKEATLLVDDVALTSVANGASLTVSSSAEAFSRLTAFSALTVPPDHPDGDAWIIAALGAGLPVLIEQTPRRAALYGSSVIYVKLSEPVAVETAIRSLPAPLCPSSSESMRWATAIEDALHEAARRRPADLAGLGPPRARLGQFIDLAKDGEGLAFRLGDKAKDAEPYGVPIVAKPLKLGIRLDELCLAPWRIAALVGADQPIASVSMTLTAHDLCRTVRWSRPRDGWGWITLTVEPSELRGLSTLELMLTMERTSTGGDGEAFVGGIVVYPDDRDHLWFEMLDGASRGTIGTLRAIAARATRTRSDIPSGV